MLFIIKLMAKLMTATKTKILTKQKVMLAVGISTLGVAGYLAAGAIIDVNSQIKSSANNYEIQLDIPVYLDESLRHPQKFFSGRDIKIVEKSTAIGKDKGKTTSKPLPTSFTLTKRDKLTKMRFSKKDIAMQEQRGKSVLKIPEDTKNGYYTIDFQIGGEQILAPIEIEGATSAETVSLSELQSQAPSLDKSILSTKRLNCGFCYWELASIINPNNENYGYLTGGRMTRGDFVQTNDGWQTSFSSSVNTITANLTRNMMGDPKFAFSHENKLTLVGVIYKIYESMSGGIFQEQQSNSFPVQFTQTTIKQPRTFSQSDPTYNSLSPPLDFDYPKIAADTNPDSNYFGNIYVRAIARSAAGRWEQEMFVIDKSGSVKEMTVSNSRGGSIKVGLDGKVYIGRSNGKEYTIAVSSNGGLNFYLKTIASKIVGGSFCSVGVSSTSNRSFFSYSGPELAVDKNNGRIYAVWSDYKQCVQDAILRIGMDARLIAIST